MIARAGLHPRLWWALAGAALLLAAGPRPSPAQPAPMSVNDCTLLPDPGALRRCLDQAEGRTPALPAPVADPATDRVGPGPQARQPRLASPPPPAEQPDFLKQGRARTLEKRPTGPNIIELQ